MINKFISDFKNGEEKAEKIYNIFVESFQESGAEVAIQDSIIEYNINYEVVNKRTFVNALRIIYNSDLKNVYKNQIKRRR